MMLILEIAAGIVLAVTVLVWWQEILALGAWGLVMMLVFAGAAYGLHALNAFVPLAQIFAWLVLLFALFVVCSFLYGYITGKWNVSETEAQQWAEKSMREKWLDRVLTFFASLIFGGGAVIWSLSTIGILR